MAPMERFEGEHETDDGRIWKDDDGVWRKGIDHLFTVIVGHLRFPRWALNADDAKADVVLEEYVGRQRSAPRPDEISVRLATDDEARDVDHYEKRGGEPYRRALRRTTQTSSLLDDLNRPTAAATPGPPSDPLLDAKLRSALHRPVTTPSSLLSRRTTTARGAPSTSRKAGRKASIKAGQNRHRVLTWIVESGEVGLTDEEMQDKGMSPNTQRPRRGELDRSGFIEPRKGPHGGTMVRPTRSDTPATIWVATAEGRAALDAANNQGACEAQ